MTINLNKQSCLWFYAIVMTLILLPAFAIQAQKVSELERKLESEVRHHKIHKASDEFKIERLNRYIKLQQSVMTPEQLLEVHELNNREAMIYTKQMIQDHLESKNLR